MKPIPRLFPLLLMCACSGTKSAPIVVLSTESADSGPSRTDVEVLVERDAGNSLDILNAAVSGEDRRLAAFAAAYLKRLGMKSDDALLEKAFLDGICSEDPLAAALSWRWFASGDFEVPEKPGEEPPRDPGMRALAALSFARLGNVPDELADALWVPEEPPGQREGVFVPSGRLETLKAWFSPFDGGPLAEAVYFAEATRAKWKQDVKEGGAVWTAGVVRERLLKELKIERTEWLRDVRSPEEPPPSCVLADLARNPIVNQDLGTVRVASVKGDTSLRIFALRALAAAVIAPTAGDLGAAAAAMRSDDPFVKIEAARTFALLAIRSTTESD